MDSQDIATKNPYFGGTGITLEKLKAVMPTINVDGTTYQIEDWLAECAVFKALVPNVSKLWIPYGVWERGVVTEVVWDKHTFSSYNNPTEMQDWWVAEPYAKVQYRAEGEYFVYEISFYKGWKRKTQMQHLMAQQQKPKRKFLSKEDIVELKKLEIITNSQKKL